MPCGHFSPDGRWVLTGSYDGTTRVWDAETGGQRARFSGTGGVQQLAISAAARTLAVCGTGRELNLFDLTLTEPSGADRARIRALLEKLDDDSYEVREATSAELLRLGFVAEAELRRAAKEAKSAEVRIRARRLRQEMLSRPRATLRGHTDAVEGLAFTPDGKLLASAGRDGTVRLWELPAGQEVARLVPGD
jgi:WD40 repeat protein